jgi:hypothetical protein
MLSWLTLGVNAPLHYQVRHPLDIPNVRSSDDMLTVIKPLSLQMSNWSLKI